MKQIQTHGPSKYKVPSLKAIGFMAAALVLGLSSISAWAAGTASGVSITNQANLNYTVGGVPQTAILSDDPTVAGQQATAFVVDNKINLTVARVDATRVNAVNGQVAATPLPNPPAYLTFTVTNNGNTTQDFRLTVNNPAAGATDPFGAPVTAFATSNCRTFVESGGGATTLQIGTDTEVAYIDNLAADASRQVYLVCDTPFAATNGQTGVAGLTAEAVDAAGSSGTPSASYTVAQLTAANTQAGVELVAADVAGSEGDVARDAKHSARDTYVIATAVLSVNKTITTICDPFNSTTSPKNIPGGVVRWTIAIANTGGASASLTTIADTLNSNTTFDPDLITGAGGAAGCEFAAAGAGTPENANARGFKITNSVARPMLGAPGGTVTSSFFTTAADADGLDAVGAAVNAVLNTALPAGGAYSAGELKAGETLTIYFNVGIN